MRKLALSVAAVLMVAAWASGVGAATLAKKTPPGPRKVFEAYLDDFNRGDGTAAASLFATDAVLTTPLGGCSPCVGRAVIQQHLTGANGNQTRIAIRHVRVKGARVSGDATVTSPQFPAGIQRVIGPFRMTVRHGKITRLDAEYDRRDPQTAALLTIIEQSTPPTTG